MILTFYMKSGNTIKIKNVEDYEISNRGNEITGISIKQKKYPWTTKLLVKTIDMSNIEAVTVI